MRGENAKMCAIALTALKSYPGYITFNFITLSQRFHNVFTTLHKQRFLCNVVATLVIQRFPHNVIITLYEQR